MHKFKLLFILVLIAASNPVAARFITPDPMPTSMNTGENFNRYNYAANNPFKFTDPDGRAARIVHEEGGIRIEMPTQFTGSGATPENIATATNNFESQSGTYNVGGKATQVDFKVTEITKGTPKALQNTVKLFDGPTDHPAGTGVSYADSVGGTKASVDVTSEGFKYGVSGHELDHLAGAKDAYKRDAAGNKIPDPNRSGDIMNQLPGRMTDKVVQEIMNAPNNQHVEKKP